MILVVSSLTFRHHHVSRCFLAVFLFSWSVVAHADDGLTIDYPSYEGFRARSRLYKQDGHAYRDLLVWHGTHDVPGEYRSHRRLSRWLYDRIVARVLHYLESPVPTRAFTLDIFPCRFELVLGKRVLRGEAFPPGFNAPEETLFLADLPDAAFGRLESISVAKEFYEADIAAWERAHPE